MRGRFSHFTFFSPVLPGAGLPARRVRQVVAPFSVLGAIFDAGADPYARDNGENRPPCEIRRIDPAQPGARPVRYRSDGIF